MGDARAVLRTLIEENLLSPGSKKLYVSYYRKRVYADLLVDGSIRFKDVVYTSPVPCALQMKRTLNPSLKTDAGWSSMFSAASGESLKDIKDRLNIRKRGPNSRTLTKEKKATASAPSLSSKDKLVAAGMEITKLAAVPNCPVCHKDATSDVVSCNACQGKTHLKCAHPTLETMPSTPWFCDSCLTSQANRILEFLQQTRRVLVEVMASNAVKKEQLDKTAEEKSSESVEEHSTADKIRDDGANESTAPVVDEKVITSPDEQAEVVEGDKPVDTSTNEDEAAADNVDMKAEAKDDDHQDSKEQKEVEDGVVSDELEKEVVVERDFALEATPDSDRNKTDKHQDSSDSLTHTTVENKFLSLLDSVIDEVSCKKERMHIIANSTGATLVHLAKTQLAQLVEYGKREIAVVTESEKEDDEHDKEPTSPTSRTSEVDALIKIFDLRHQILSSQAQFERTTVALSKHTEKRLRTAEMELMELEESRTKEANAVGKIVDLIEQYTSDLNKCQEKIRYNQVLLESILHRRNFIRSSNINDRFVPSYRYSTKQMTSSSDQLLFTVLLDKLRDIAKSVNEWAKMEAHFEKMSSSLHETLQTIGTKRPREAIPSKSLSTPALFAKVKIPPSRRLIERQIANYQVNLRTIRVNRARMRKTLGGILKIAREEHLSQEIVDMTELLYQKCRDLKAEEEEQEEEEVEQQENEDVEKLVEEVDLEEPDTKKQRTDDSKTRAETIASVEQAQDTTDNMKDKVQNDIPPVNEQLPSALDGANEGKTTLSEILDGESTTDLPNNQATIDSNPPPASMESSSVEKMTSLLNGDNTSSVVVTEAQATNPEPTHFSAPSSIIDSSKDVGTELPRLGEEQTFSQSVEQVTQGHHVEPFSELLAPQPQQPIKQPSPVPQRVLEQRQTQQVSLHTVSRSVLPKKQSKQAVEIPNTTPSSFMTSALQQQQSEVQRQQQTQEQQAFINQALEVLKQQAPQRKQATQSQLQKQQSAQQPSQPPVQLQQQTHHQPHQFQRISQPLPSALNKEPTHHSPQQHHTQVPPSQLTNQLQHPVHHHPANTSHLDMLTHAHQQISQHPSQMHMQAQQQTMQHQHQHQQHPAQPQRSLQHPLYGDVQKGMSVSSGLGTTQDIYGDHTQQSHMGMDLHSHQHMHPSHLGSGDVMRQHHHSHDLGGHQSVGGGIGSHFVTPSNLRGSPFLPSNDGRGTQQQSFYADDSQQHNPVMHSHDMYGSQGLASHHHQQQQQQQQQHHHLFSNDLHQQHHSRSVNNQDFRSQLMGRHFRDPTGNNMNHPGMGPSDSDDVDMGQWN